MARTVFRSAQAKQDQAVTGTTYTDDDLLRRSVTGPGKMRAKAARGGTAPTGPSLFKRSAAPAPTTATGPSAKPSVRPSSGLIMERLGLPTQSSIPTKRISPTTKLAAPLSSKPASKPVSKPAPKPMSTMDKIRADKGLMGTIKADAAAMKKSAPAAPAAKPSSGLSANKSYSDYKKLMGE